MQIANKRQVKKIAARLRETLLQAKGKVIQRHHRKLSEEVFTKQADVFESNFLAEIKPFLKSQIASAISNLKKQADVKELQKSAVFNAAEWNAQLRQVALKPIAKAMAEAAMSQYTLAMDAVKKQKQCQSILTKCGGPGGKPGPCPQERQTLNGLDDKQIGNKFKEVVQKVLGPGQPTEDVPYPVTRSSSSHILHGRSVNAERSGIEVEIRFSQNGSFTSVSTAGLQKGSIELAHKLKELTHELAHAGFRIRSNPSDSRRHELYDKALKSIGLVELFPNLYGFPSKKSVVNDSSLDTWIELVNYKKNTKQFKSIKESTASEYLGSLSEDEQDSLQDVVFQTPYGNVFMSYGTEYPAWMKKSIENRLNETFSQPYWDDINATTGGDIENVLNQGLLEGWSIQDMADEIEKRYGSENYPEWRGKLIARTEAANALNGPRSDVIDNLKRELGDQYPMRKVWLSVLGNTTRDTHASLDGVPAAADGCWALGGIRCRWPGDVKLPAEERCNCFPGNVLVSGTFKGAQRAWYKGVITKIKTVSGGSLTVTPNHPVMTSDGWIAAGEINPGNKIMAYSLEANTPASSAARMTVSGVTGSVSDNEYDKPAFIENVFEAFLSASAYSSTSTSRSVKIRRSKMDDFYGDGEFIDGDIDVVFVDWKLLRDGDIAHFNKVGDSLLHFVDASSANELSLSTSWHSSGVFDGVSSSLPRASEPFISVCFGRITPAGSLSVGVASDFNPKFSEFFSQNMPRNSVLFAESLERYSLSVLINKTLNIRNDGVFLSASNSDAGVNKSFSNDVGGITDFFNKLRDASSGAVFFDEVVDIDHDYFEGYVYDLESDYGVIVATDCDSVNTDIGFVTSNCQCSVYTQFGMVDADAEELIAEHELRESAAGKAVIFSWLKCGGPGSGVPGPCPQPKFDDKGKIVPGSVGQLIGIDTSNIKDSLSLVVIHALEKKMAEGDVMGLMSFYASFQIAGGALTPEMKIAYKLATQKMDEIDKLPPAAHPAKGVPGQVANQVGWTKVGDQLGTEKGGTYTLDGEKYYVKQPDNPDRARNEVLALQLYSVAGGSAVPGNLVMIDGKLSVATKWMENSKGVDWNNAEAKKAAADDFAIHVWLNNRDAIGAGSENPMDNIRWNTQTGKLTLVDAGGSMNYKGMGGSGTKPFNSNVTEWDTFRDPSVNPTMAKVFGGMTPEQLISSAKKLKNVTDAHIDDLVDKSGMSDASKHHLKKTLKERRDAILAISDKLEQQLKAVSSPAPAPQSAPTPSSVSPAFPPPPDIMKGKTKTLDWYQNFQNKFNAIHAAALKGDVAAIQAIKANANSTDSYTKKVAAYKDQCLAILQAHKTNPPPAAPPPTTPAAPVAPKPAHVVAPVAVAAPSTPFVTSPVPASAPQISLSNFPAPPNFVSTIAAHVQQNTQLVTQIQSLTQQGDLVGLKAMTLPPSPKLQSWHASMVAQLAKTLNPPPPPVAMTSLNDSQKKLIESIKSNHKVHNETVSATQKVGYWTTLGKVDAVQEGVNPGTWKPDGTPALWSNGSSSYQKSSKATNKDGEYPQSPVKTYTGGMYKHMNAALRDHASGKTSGVSKGDFNMAVTAGQHIMQYGHEIPAGTLLSRNYAPTGSALAAHVKDLKPGHVISDPAILSTSTDPKVFFETGGVHMRLTVGEGVKGIAVKDFSNHPSEKEVILAPNQRIMITKVEQVPAKEVNGLQNVTMSTNLTTVIHAIILPTVDSQCCPDKM